MSIENLDPVKYAIFCHKIDNILEEGKEVVRYLSGSTITREAGEVQEAFYLPSGDGVAIACGILMHIMNVTRVINYMKEEGYARDIGIYEGDQFINNDAYIGGMHVPDTAIVEPLFFDDKLIGYTASISHTPEVGAIEPGGMSPAAREAYHDGLHLPAVKLVDRGKMRRDVFNMILRSAREPRGIELDMRARIAGNERVRARLKDLIREVGLEFFLSACEKRVNDAEAFARNRVKELKPGIYRSQAFTDTFYGNENKLAVVQVELEVKETGEIIVSTPVVSPQAPCFDNAYLPAVEATLFYTVLVTLLPDGIWNTGLARVIKVGHIPSQSRLNADASASVGYATVGIGSVFCNALTDALSRAFYASGKKDEVLAPATLINDTPIGGLNQWGRPFGTMLTSSAMTSGGGARIGRDGIDTGVNMWNPWTYITDAEGEEQLAPIIHVLRKQRPESGGPGKWRGGVGVAHVTMIHGSDKVQVLHFGAGGKVPTNQGMFGGYPGAASYFDWVLDSDIYQKFNEGIASSNSQEALENFEGTHIPGPPNVLARSVKPGDFWLSTSNGGGAGSGDPLERDPEAVQKDIEDGVTTREFCEKNYGIVFNDDGIDFAKTAANKNEMRKQRLLKGIPASDYIKALVNRRNEGNLPKVAIDFINETLAFSEDFSELLQAEERIATQNTKNNAQKASRKKTILNLTPYLDLIEDSNGETLIVCSQCDTIYCRPSENFKYFSLISERAPKEIQPGRLSFDGEWITYREFYCPGCAAQIEVEAVPPGWPILKTYEIQL